MMNYKDSIQESHYIYILNRSGKISNSIVVVSGVGVELFAKIFAKQSEVWYLYFVF